MLLDLVVWVVLVWFVVWLELLVWWVECLLLYLLYSMHLRLLLLPASDDNSQPQSTLLLLQW